jgi:hypothetical protein
MCNHGHGDVVATWCNQGPFYFHFSQGIKQHLNTEYTLSGPADIFTIKS